MGLDTVELAMAFEKAFELTIPDQDAARLLTVGDVTDYVTARLAAEGRPRDRDLVGALVRSLTCAQVGARLDQLSDATRFVADLGMG